MATFLEGVESITLACTIIILLPVLALAMAARRGRPQIVGAYLVGASMLMWGRAARIWEVESTGTIAVAIGAAIAASFVLVATTPDQTTRRIAALRLPAMGLVGGAIAGWLWEPCVGEQFAEILNNADANQGFGTRLQSFALMLVYVAGTLLPAILFAAVAYAAPRTEAGLHHRVVRATGLGLGLIYAVTVSAGWYSDLVAELFRISSS